MAESSSELPRSVAVAGGEHTLFKSANGNLTSAGACGLNWCRLHPLNTSLFSFRPVRLTFQTRKSVASASAHNNNSSADKSINTCSDNAVKDQKGAGFVNANAASDDYSSSEAVSMVHASYYHNLAVGKYTGALYTWGCGTFVEGGMDGVIPALGQGRDAKDIGAAPKEVNLNLNLNLPKKEWIKGITGGAYHSAVLLNTGKVLTFGANQLGQLGRPIVRQESVDDDLHDSGSASASTSTGDASGLPVDPVPSEAIIQNPNGEGSSSTSSSSFQIKKIGAGFYNTFAICNKGKLLCTGENQNMQCGDGPKNLFAFAAVKEVNDEIKSTGRGRGRGRDVDISDHDDVDSVDQVEGGYCHTLVKTLAGKVMSLGCGDDGQRGDGRLGDDPTRPILTSLNLPHDIMAKQVAAGANHSVILGTDGNAYTFGANDVGQCGVPSDPHPQSSLGHDDDDGDDDDDNYNEEEDWEGVPILSPKRVELPGTDSKVAHVSAGYAHTVLTTEDGQTYVFGQNDNGQLGLGKDAFEDQEPHTSPIKI